MAHLNTKQITSCPAHIVEIMVKFALSEDIGTGDINAMLMDDNATCQAKVITRESMVVCGLPWVIEVFNQVDKNVKVVLKCKEGDRLNANDIIFEVSGDSGSVLMAERNALNFLQMLSGIATTTSFYVEKIKGTNAKVLDTRKTIPMFRMAQKYAVKIGGGYNHRMGLYDAFLIKENHILACDNSITKAVEKARNITKDRMIEVEVENFNQLEEAIKMNVDVVMLDNFSLVDMVKSVKIVNKKIAIEASGNINIDTIKDVADTGVDYISIGCLTKNIQSIDLSMRFF